MPLYRREYFRRTVTLRVDYTTAQERVEMGIVRTLSMQGMSIEYASRHVVHEVVPGDLLTVAFALPSGRPCKLPAVVVHGDRQGCGVEFRQGHPQSRTNLSRYWVGLD
jgi:hypothetical protein